jgi:hypothetical protein
MGMQKFKEFIPKIKALKDNDLDSSSGFKRILKALTPKPNSSSPDSSSPDTGGFFKRLTTADIEAENKTGMKKGGKVSSASKRADGIATKGKTRGKMV